MSELHRPQPRQWDFRALVPLVAGLVWLSAVDGIAWWLWALLPGVILVAAGCSQLLWPGDHRIPQFMAAGSFVGLLFAIPALFTGDGLCVLLGAALSAVSFRNAGALAREQMALPEGVTVGAGWRNDAKIALDDALLAYFRGTAMLPSGSKADLVCEELVEARSLLKLRGWISKPTAAHQPPEPPIHQSVERRRIYGRDYEVLSFASGFETDQEMPGAERWQSYTANQRTCAWVMRHPGRERPWLMGIHGYRMGMPWLDFSLFDPRWLHDHLGFNLILPVLPLHGPRRAGWRSGDEYLDGDFMDVYHAQSQALWDIRQTLALLRQQEDAPRVGVMGFSLGGYNAALLAQHDDNLDFVVAGIPLTDIAAALWQNIPPAHAAYYEHRGASEALFREVLRPVSPLASAPKIDREHLHIFAGTADRLVPPAEVMKLAEHWQVPVDWFDGAHLTFRGEPAVSRTLRTAAERAGWPLPKAG